jgi:hypothetical protein
MDLSLQNRLSIVAISYRSELAIMSRRKRPFKSWADILPAGALTAIPPNAVDVDFKPYDNTDIVFTSESGEVYTSFDLSVLDGLKKTKR